jgi:hypothetical protein
MTASRDDVWPRQLSLPGWGEWAIGDLTQALLRAESLLSASAPVEGVTIDLRGSLSVMPRVSIIVKDESQVAELRSRVAASEYMPHFLGKPLPWVFTAEVDDLHLRVLCLDEGGDR